MADRVNSIDELERMQAVAGTQGATVPNYHEWSQIMADLEEAGVSSTGSYQGDKALHTEIINTVEDHIEQTQIKETQQQQEIQQEQPKNISETDNEQAIKATVANATSSVILSDYMKYYHMLS